MTNERTCEACGAKFKLTWEELEELPRAVRPGMHLPSNCPENMDTFCPFCDLETEGPTECKSCRPKQDQQRS